MHRKTHFDNVPVKPQRVYEEMNQAFGRDTRYVSTIGLSQIAGAQMLHVFSRATGSTAARPGRWAGPSRPPLGVVAADPARNVVALSGDYDFQFMIEELAVGAQFNLPYIHVLVNNSYLGLIRQAQRAFNMDYFVRSASTTSTPTTPSAGQGLRRGPRQVAEGLGCKAIRVEDPADMPAAFDKAKALMDEFKVPVVVEVILEKVTNISMGAADIDGINEFEALAESGADAPTALLPLD